MGRNNIRHKTENTFKFLLFSERIANVNINIFHRIGHEYEDQYEINRTIFSQTIEKWNALNLTANYCAFRREINPNNLITLPQLVLHKEEVVRVLIKYLQLKDGLSLQPLLELVVALVNDLGKDFYPYYEEFLKVLIRLLNTKETDQLEWTFTCLAYIFKVLWRTLVKNINVVFNNLLPLLSDDRKDYMVNFAAESFAYVVRKVKDRQYFLNLLLKGVKNNKDGVNGCGTLLFEAMRGVNGQFHSFAEAIFPFLLKSLTTDKSTQQILFEVLQQIIFHIASDIKPQNSKLLWSSLITNLEEQLDVCKSNFTDDAATNIAFLLQLIGAAIEHNGGKLLCDPVSITKVISKCLDQNLTNEVLTVTANISVLLLMSPNVRLPQEQAYMLTKRVTSVNDTILLHFVDHIMPYPSFEALILPAFLKRCSENNLSSEFLAMLTKLIIHKAAPSKDGVNLENWSKYPLDFNTKEENGKVVALMLEKNRIGSENMDDSVCSTICLPHLILNEYESKAKDLLNNNLAFLFEQISNSEVQDLAVKRRWLFLLHLTLGSSLSILSKDELLLYFDQILKSILPLSSNPEVITALQILNLYFNYMKDQSEIIDLNILLNLNEILKCNFTSPYHEMRILTTNIYKLFENVPELKAEDSEVAWNVFTLCYEVEAVETNINTYRDQLKNLELLSFHKQGKLCQHVELKSISLRFLFSVFYKNFKLVWNPVMDIISTYTEGFEKTLFWNVLVDKLRGVVAHIRDPPSFTDAQLESECDFLETLYGDLYGIDTKQSKFNNYRQLLWKTLMHFPHVVEENNRDMAELLINFVEKEYTNTEDSDTTIKMDSGASITQTLLDHLKVFTKFHNPKAAHRQSELEKLYFDLLSHKNHEVQKLAFDCIMTYKHKYLLPYQDHLYNLISENNFKNELATFRIDTEDSIIVPEHREQLMFVVLKIVYSKMTAKTGMRTGGKASGQNRRHLVLRFLSGCNENEKLSFVKIAFRFYQEYFDVNAKTMIENITQNMDLEKFVSPKRLQSALNLLMLVVQKFGGSVGHEILSFLLKVLFVIGAQVKGAYENATEVHAGFLASLKNLRKLSLNILETFFAHFTSYPWKSEEIDVVFTIFVWPILGKLETDGIYSPTVLLKLFSQWSSHPPYFTLLVKQAPENQNKLEYALAHVIKLLVNKQSHPTVTNVILDMIHNLLRLIPDENETAATQLPVENVLPLSSVVLERQKITKNLNYGSSILLPHVKSILHIFERKFKSKSKSAISNRDLFILTRISELVWESSTCDEVLKLFLPVVTKKCFLGEEIVTNYITTVSNLLENVEKPQSHFEQISPLFGDISYISCRKIMCSMLDSIARRNSDPKLLEISTLMNDLNAWDKKWVEQPNFETRLEGYKRVQSLIDSESLELTQGILVIFNCFHAIRNENDLALKENSITCWRNTAVALLKRYESDCNTISYILKVLFNIIRKGLKNKDDEVRNEIILLLGHLARESPNSHSILRDLNSLTNKVDVEVDFFENITHIQLHRHHRALVKFCATFRKLENSPNPKTLTQFILPIASHYLMNEKYAAKNSLIDSAIDTVSVASRLVPWLQYESILKYYLVEIRRSSVFQNQLVRLMIAVLNSFHFDLRNRQKMEGEIEEKNEEEEIDVEETEENDIDVENFDEEPEHVEETPEQESTKVEKSVDKIQVLAPFAATSFFRKIRSNLLPKLHGTLAEMTQHDGAHKINRKKLGFEREEEDLSRVPIYYAVVKLLQQLPKEMMEANLPSIFIKLCTYLKSQMESVRRTTREMLQKIILTLGPSYLDMLLDHMVTLLSRGFEVHVLVFTVHGILLCLKEQYRPRDLDKVLLTVLQLCQADLFGVVADEKEVVQIGRKVSEAKSTKSYEILKILAKYITEKCFMDLLLPMKTILTTSHSFKNVQKARDALRNIGLGLVDNEFVEIESLFTIAYGISSESVTQLLMTKEKDLVVKETKRLEKERPDCFLIPAAPVGRSGFRKTGVKSSETANAHVLVEFGLRLCFYLLKDEKVRDDKIKSLVDPFVEIFKNCLTSRHVKLNTLTLNCLTKILKYELPSLRENVHEISEAMFAVLHKYAAAGLSKGDNFELVMAAFKAMTVMVRDVKYYTINNEHLKVLLLYVEQDLHNNDRQTTALTLLRAIITRKLSSNELHEVMEKVAHLSITSEATHIRLQCRIVFHQFLMDYALKVDVHVPFYVEQLKYEMQSGRESAIEMIRTIITTFPYKTLLKFSSLFLTHLGMRLINEEVVVCKEMLANTLMELFRKLKKPNLVPLFNMMLVLLKDKKLAHQQMAAQLCGLLLEVETVSFESRLNDLIPALLKQLRISEEFQKPGSILVIKKETNDVDNAQNRLKDHCTFQTLQLLLKLCSKCPVFLKRDEVPKLAKHVQTLLGYPHDWVRLAALQFLGYVFNSLDVSKLSDLLLSNESESSGYLCGDTANEIKSLTLDMCAQLNTDTREDIAEQVIKNLVFIAKVVQSVPLKGEQKVNIFWLTKLLRRVINEEIVEDAASIKLRTHIFHWIGAVGQFLEVETIKSILYHLMAPLVREMTTTEESNAPLRQLSKKVCNIYKNRVGNDLYTATLSKLEGHLNKKRGERKRVRTQLAVNDPEMFAKRKIRVHEKKREAKKRKAKDEVAKKRKIKKKRMERDDGDDEDIM